MTDNDLRWYREENERLKRANDRLWLVVCVLPIVMYIIGDVIGVLTR